VGRAVERGTRRIVGQVGGMRLELVLDEGDEGRGWRVYIYNCGEPTL
jgi:hypothetical protein